MKKKTILSFYKVLAGFELNAIYSNMEIRSKQGLNVVNGVWCMTFHYTAPIY